jgi:ribonuclease BN (tRNA processing enzyme)
VTPARRVGKYTQVKLTVIGCSPAWPNPGGAHSGYLVEDVGVLLLDCGPGVLARLRTNGLRDVEAIVISHFHLDHWGDLVAWAWLSASSRGTAPRPALWLPPGGTAELAAFAARWGHPTMFDSAFELHEYDSGVPFAAAGFEIVAYAVEHYDFPAHGLRVQSRAGHVLAYSGDSSPCDGVRALAAGADLFLCEATLASGGSDASPRGHMAADEAIAASDGGRVLLTHRPAELPTPAGAARAVDGLSVDV